MNLLINCSIFKKESPQPIIVQRDLCVLSGKFSASTEDKTALKQSKVTKEFIKQFVDHNDLWDETCKAIIPTLTITSPKAELNLKLK